MDLLGFGFILSSVASFAASVALIALGKAYGFPVSGLAFLFLGAILLCIGIALVWLAFRICLKRLGVEHFSLSKRISARWASSGTIVFSKIDGSWLSEWGGRPVSFDLRGLIFKKSFLLAFTIRAVRYPIVSDKLPIAALAKRSLVGFPKNAHINAVFQDGSRKSSFAVVENGQSKCGLIPKLVIQSRLPSKYARHKPVSKSAGSRVIRINEESFISSF